MGEVSGGGKDRSGGGKPSGTQNLLLALCTLANPSSMMSEISQRLGHWQMEVTLASETFRDLTGDLGAKRPAIFLVFSSPFVKNFVKPLVFSQITSAPQIVRKNCLKIIITKLKFKITR